MNIRNQHLLNLENNLAGNGQDLSECLMISNRSQRETYSSICAVPTPRPTRTHMPIPNSVLIDLTAQANLDQGRAITGAAYASSYNQGNAHFLFQLNHTLIPGVHMQIGGHKSHIKMVASMLLLQTHGGICTNMDSPAAVPLRRKHTTNILEELAFLVTQAVGKLKVEAQHHTDRLGLYQDRIINDYDAHDLMIRALEENIVPATYIPEVNREWKFPSHDEFKERSLYSLYNCFTEVYKRAPAETPHRTRGLIKLFDALVPVETPAEAIYPHHTFVDSDNE